MGLELGRHVHVLCHDAFARFRAGVAVAPVTDWRNYDSIYTERYLGVPAEDPDAYRDFSVVNSAANLKGR